MDPLELCTLLDTPAVTSSTRSLTGEHSSMIYALQPDDVPYLSCKHFCSVLFEVVAVCITQLASYQVLSLACTSDCQSGT
jgi:hypothetical protein